MRPRYQNRKSLHMEGRESGLLRSRMLAPGLIALNAIGLLLFRHFVSLDGPMHLLHAAVQRDAWMGVTRQAEGLWVDTSALDLNLGDLLLIPLTGLLAPFALHTLMAALVLTCVQAGAWRLALAYNTEPNGSWSLVLPCSVGFVLILGLFHFLLAMGLALLVLAWWVALPTVHWKQLAILLGASALCLFAHKAGAGILLLLVLVHEVTFRCLSKEGWRTRWGALPGWFIPSAALLIIASGLLMVALRFAPTAVHRHEPHRPLNELLTLRPLLLLDSRAERPFRIVLGASFVFLLIAAVARRIRMKTLVNGDALLFSAVLLLAVSLIRTPKTELLYVTDRAQWLALLLLACWLSVQVIPTKLVRVIGLCVVTLHGLRMLYLERRMHHYALADEAALAASDHFENGALVVPVMLDTDWLARHRTAYPALRHKGIVLTGRDHLRFAWDTPPDIHVRRYIVSFEDNCAWIGEHLRRGASPPLNQILVLGTPTHDSGRLAEQLSMLHAYYRPLEPTGHTQIWSRHTEPPFRGPLGTADTLLATPVGAERLSP